MNIYTGLNIQYPISREILNGKKVIETRTYEISKKLLNIELVMIETPGEMGQFKSRAIAIFKVKKCFKYKSKEEFYNDINRHKVTKDSEWAWKDKSKYGWEIEIIKKIDPPIIITKKKGIIYTNNLELPI